MEIRSLLKSYRNVELQSQKIKKNNGPVAYPQPIKAIRPNSHKFPTSNTKKLLNRVKKLGRKTALENLKKKLKARELEIMGKENRSGINNQKIFSVSNQFADKQLGGSFGKNGNRGILDSAKVKDNNRAKRGGHDSKNPNREDTNYPENRKNKGKNSRRKSRKTKATRKSRAKVKVNLKGFKILGRTLDKTLEAVNEIQQLKKNKAIRQLKMLCELKIKFWKFSFWEGLNMIEIFKTQNKNQNSSISKHQKSKLKTRKSTQNKNFEKEISKESQIEQIKNLPKTQNPPQIFHIDLEKISDLRVTDESDELRNQEESLITGVSSYSFDNNTPFKAAFGSDKKSESKVSDPSCRKLLSGKEKNERQVRQSVRGGVEIKNSEINLENYENESKNQMLLKAGYGFKNKNDFDSREYYNPQNEDIKTSKNSDLTPNNNYHFEEETFFANTTDQTSNHERELFCETDIPEIDQQYLSQEFDIYRLKQKSFGALKNNWVFKREMRQKVIQSNFILQAKVEEYLSGLKSEKDSETDSFGKLKSHHDHTKTEPVFQENYNLKINRNPDKKFSNPNSEYSDNKNQHSTDFAEKTPFEESKIDSNPNQSSRRESPTKNSIISKKRYKSAEIDIFVIEERDEEYRYPDTSFTRDDSGLGLPKKFQTEKAEIKKMLQGSLRSRRENMKRRMKKIEDLKSSRREMEKWKLAEERRLKKRIRKDIDRQILEKRKKREEAQKRKEKAKEKRRQKIKSANNYNKIRLKKRVFLWYQFLNQKRFNQLEKITQTLQIKKKTRIFKKLKERIELLSFETQQKLISFKLRIQEPNLKSRFFQNLKNACSISKYDFEEDLTKFKSNFLRKIWFRKWRKQIPELRRQNFWRREQEKKIILRFRMKKNKILKRKGFATLRKWLERKRGERRKERRKGQLRLQVKNWLREFKTKKIR